jgi:hypothetical protein
MKSTPHIPWQGGQDFETRTTLIDNHTQRIETVGPDGKTIDALIVAANTDGTLRLHTKDGPGVAEAAHLTKILAA